MILFHLSVRYTYEYYSTKEFNCLQSEKVCPSTSVHNKDLYRFIHGKVVPQRMHRIKTSISLYLKGVSNNICIK